MATQAVQFRVDGKKVGGRMAIDAAGYARLDVPAATGDHMLVAELHEQKGKGWVKVAESAQVKITVTAYVEGL